MQQIESIFTPLIKTAASVYKNTFGLIPSFLCEIEINEADIQLQWKPPTTWKSRIWTLWIALHIFGTCVGTSFILVQKFLHPNDVQVGLLEFAAFAFIFGSYCWLIMLLYHLHYSKYSLPLRNRMFANKLHYSKLTQNIFVSLKNSLF